MGFYHDAFAGMLREQVHGKLFVCFFGPGAFLRGLPVNCYTMLRQSLLIFSNELIFFSIYKNLLDY